jgi:hypothetical protein
MNNDKQSMWPFIIGTGIVALLINELLGEEERPKKLRKRIFISFAIEDKKYRDFLVAQAKNEKSPFSFVDMSVKQPWDEEIWKQKCRTRIKSCDGMIVLLSKNIWHSSGARWEMKCAQEESISTIGMHITKSDRGAIPPELEGKKIIPWSWRDLGRTVDGL